MLGDLDVAGDPGLQNVMMVSEEGVENDTAQLLDDFDQVAGQFQDDQLFSGFDFLGPADEWPGDPSAGEDAVDALINGDDHGESLLLDSFGENQSGSHLEGAFEEDYRKRGRRNSNMRAVFSTGDLESLQSSYNSYVHTSSLQKMWEEEPTYFVSQLDDHSQEPTRTDVAEELKEVNPMKGEMKPVLVKQMHGNGNGTMRPSMMGDGQQHGQMMTQNGVRQVMGNGVPNQQSQQQQQGQVQYASLPEASQQTNQMVGDPQQMYYVNQNGGIQSSQPMMNGGSPVMLVTSGPPPAGGSQPPMSIQQQQVNASNMHMHQPQDQQQQQISSQQQQQLSAGQMVQVGPNGVPMQLHPDGRLRAISQGHQANGQRMHVQLQQTPAGPVQVLQSSEPHGQMRQARALSYPGAQHIAHGPQGAMPHPQQVQHHIPQTSQHPHMSNHGQPVQMHVQPGVHPAPHPAHMHQVPQKVQQMPAQQPIPASIVQSQPGQPGTQMMHPGHPPQMMPIFVGPPPNSNHATPATQHQQTMPGHIPHQSNMSGHVQVPQHQHPHQAPPSHQHPQIVVSGPPMQAPGGPMPYPQPQVMQPILVPVSQPPPHTTAAPAQFAPPPQRLPQPGRPVGASTSPHCRSILRTIAPAPSPGTRPAPNSRLGGMVMSAPGSQHAPPGSLAFHSTPEHSIALHPGHPMSHRTLSAVRPESNSQMIRRVQSTGDLQSMSAQSNLVIPTDSLDARSRALLRVGRYTMAQRRSRIMRYKEKKNARNYSKKLKYNCRKTLAETRPRERGRFAKWQGEGPPPAEYDEHGNLIECDEDEDMDDDDDDDDEEEQEETPTTGATDIKSASSQTSQPAADASGAESGTNEGELQPAKSNESAAASSASDISATASI